MIKFGLITAALFVTAFFIAADSEMFEILYDMTRKYEAYQLDEIFSVIIIFSLFLLIFSFYMNFRLTRAINLRTRAEQQLEKLNHSLEDRIRERTRDLDNINIRLEAEMAERKEIEAQLVQKQKMEAVGTMAGGIAHDFNTLLGIIMGYAGMVKARAETGELKEMGEEILDAAHRSKVLICRLQDFNAPDPVKKTGTELKSVIRDSVKLLTAALPSNIRVRTDLPEAPCPAKANNGQLTQVLVNLGVNAGHAMGKKRGEIGFSLDQIQVSPAKAKGKGVNSGEFNRITVSDTGCGIEPSIMDNIFDPFFTTKGVGEGSGLGLSVAFGIVKAHNGYIEVDSRPDEGSRFHVIIPKTENPTAPAAGDLSGEKPDQGE